MNACHKALDLLHSGKVDEARAFLDSICERPAGADGYEDAARFMGNDELEFDDRVCFSIGEDDEGTSKPNGCWVSAWVWVYRVDAEAQEVKP